jgi:hypothetical protein
MNVMRWFALGLSIDHQKVTPPAFPVKECRVAVSPAEPWGGGRICSESRGKLKHLKNKYRERPAG